jgi:BirA family transcriptional regulator, biotin operon repressor / biotin---[acetyl-CoA-carboxylase] ligase
MSSPYADLDRPPLSPRAIDAALRHHVGAAQMWRRVRVVAQTGSTNADVAAAASAGEAEGLVVVAERQGAGRGRLDRTWTSPPRAGLTFSLLLRPAVPVAARPLLPLLVATAAAAAASERTELDVRLKWPNDLVVDDRKVGGLLAEAIGDAVVVGVGVNVSTRPAELPRADATSLAIESGGPVDRQALLLAILRAVSDHYVRWLAQGGAARDVLARYRAASATIGRQARVQLPAGDVLTGTAVDVDEGGRLLIDGPAGRRAVSAGDVVHVRPG